MILYPNAIQRLRLYLDTVSFDDATYNALVDRIETLPASSAQFVVALLVFPEVGKTDAVVSDHILYSLPKLLDLVEVKLGDLQTYGATEITDTIKTITQLQEDVVRIKMLQTVYLALLFDTPDVAFTLVNKFKELTDDLLFFEELSEEDAMLYRKLYILLLSAYVTLWPKEVMNHFLASGLYFIALVSDFELTPILTAHIQYYITIDIRRDLSLGFAASLAINETELGEGKNKKPMKIKDWVAYAQPVLSADRTAFNQWLEQDPEIAANTPLMTSFIRKALLLYYAFVSGYFIIEPGGEADVEKRIIELEAEAQKKVSAQFSTTQTFPELLQSQKKQDPAWLTSTTTFQVALQWLKSFSSQAEGAKAILAELRRAYPNPQAEWVEALSRLLVFLGKNGYEFPRDPLYFDESTQQFAWS